LIEYDHDDWVNLFRERLSQYPVPDEQVFTLVDPYENSYLLSSIDIERGKKNRCVTPDEFIEFLQVEIEGWFFENRLSSICTSRVAGEIKKAKEAKDKRMAVKRALDISKDEEKKLIDKWERALAKEGMPAELPSCADYSLDDPDLMAKINREYIEPDEFLERLIEKAKEKLTERERKVFELYVDFRMKQIEIARLLGVSLKAVERTFNRAKIKLQNELKFLYE
jgi:RNA polymerase sigma factor (sigma-70 family)